MVQKKAAGVTVYGGRIFSRPLLRSVSKSELQPRSFNLTLYEIKTAQPPRAIICTAEAALRLHCITDYRSSMINGSGAPARQILGNGVINGRCRTILAPPPSIPPPPLSPSVSGRFSRAIGKTLQGLFLFIYFSPFLGQAHTHFPRTSGWRGRVS